MIEKYPQSALMKINAWLAVTAWVAFLSIAGLYALVFFEVGIGEKTTLNAFIITFVAFIVSALGHLVLGIYLKCPNCQKRPTVQGFQAIHPASNKVAGISGWAGVIVNIISKGKFKCIHCGSGFHV